MRVTRFLLFMFAAALLVIVQKSSAFEMVVEYQDPEDAIEFQDFDEPSYPDNAVDNKKLDFTIDKDEPHEDGYDFENLNAVNEDDSDNDDHMSKHSLGDTDSEKRQVENQKNSPWGSRRSWGGRGRSRSSWRSARRRSSWRSTRRRSSWRSTRRRSSWRSTRRRSSWRSTRRRSSFRSTRRRSSWRSTRRRSSLRSTRRRSSLRSTRRRSSWRSKRRRSSLHSSRRRALTRRRKSRFRKRRFLPGRRRNSRFWRRTRRTQAQRKRVVKKIGGWLSRTWRKITKTLGKGKFRIRIALGGGGGGQTGGGGGGGGQTGGGGSGGGGSTQPVCDRQCKMQIRKLLNFVKILEQSYCAFYGSKHNQTDFLKYRDADNASKVFDSYIAESLALRTKEVENIKTIDSKMQFKTAAQLNADCVNAISATLPCKSPKAGIVKAFQALRCAAACKGADYNACQKSDGYLTTALENAIKAYTAQIEAKAKQAK